MTIQELRVLCDATIRQYASERIKEPAQVTLVLTRKREPQGERVRLFGNRGPMGEILNTQHNEDGKRIDVVAHFSAWDILHFLSTLT